MKNRLIEKLFLTAFMLLCLLPSLGILVFGASEAAANEVLAPKPSILKRDGTFNPQVLSDTVDWAADHVALRQEYVTAWAGLNAALCRTSVEEKVILGKGDWLYYADTADDYRGAGIGGQRLSAAVRNLSLMQEYVEGKGADFLFTIAPNKNSLYPDPMPDFYPENHAGSDAEKMKKLLSQAGVPYADLFSPFLAEEKILYFQTDSHWNTEGAALAADCLLSALGMKSACYRQTFVQGEPHRGDLYEMLYPAGKRLENDVEYGPGFTFQTQKDPNEGNAISIEAHSPSGEGRLLCWRDSFGSSLYPYLAESFAESVFSRSVSYDLARMENENTSAVIIELVERNLVYLVENMAVYPAPERQRPQCRTSEEVLSLQRQQGRTASSRDLTELRVPLPGGEFDPGVPVYFICEEKCFEAAVLYPREDQPVACAWVPADMAENVSVAFSAAGELICCRTS